jgi:hypothetical protein
VRWYCTYFDTEYLARGQALIRSLHAHATPFRLFVLCLDDATYQALAHQHDVTRIRLCDIEDHVPGLIQAKADRSLLEYYYTCTPALMGYVLDRHRDVAALTYLDADVFFFSSPEPLYAEIGAASIAIIEHRFPERLRGLAEYGRFNVGWVTFTREASAIACLEDWRSQCIEWCFDRVEPARYGDQKYLDVWPERFESVVILQHQGANVAPWNVAQYQIQNRSGMVCVGNVPLVFYHFHGLMHSADELLESGLARYGTELTEDLRTFVYAPYLQALATDNSADADNAGDDILI